MPINFEQWVGIQQLAKQMEKRFKIMPKLSFTPSKPKESVYRVRVGRKAAQQHQMEIKEEGARGISFSPRKSKLGLFRAARRVEAADTFLLQEKTHRLSNTNESSSPQGEHSRQQRLSKPLSVARNNRSMSNGRLQVPREKAIQRTVSIVIEGKEEGEVMNTLSRIIMGGQDDLFFEFVEESSIHGDEQNFIEMDSRLLTEQLSSHHTVIQI